LGGADFCRHSLRWINHGRIAYVLCGLSATHSPHPVQKARWGSTVLHSGWLARKSRRSVSVRVDFDASVSAGACSLSDAIDVRTRERERAALDRGRTGSGVKCLSRVLTWALAAVSSEAGAEDFADARVFYVDWLVSSEQAYVSRG